MAGCPLYTKVDSVKVRLANKVQFQADPKTLEEGELPNALLLQLISDAEASVESDLRGRYAIPFRSKTTGNYDGLPDHTKRQIRMVVDMRSVMNVLDTDFGMGTHIDPAKYYTTVSTRYDAEIKKLMGQDVEGKERDRFRFTPPLEDLMLAASNSMADDGYKGMLINTDGRGDAGSFAEDQINDPSIGVFGGVRRF